MPGGSTPMPRAKGGRGRETGGKAGRSLFPGQKRGKKAAYVFSTPAASRIIPFLRSPVARVGKTGAGEAVEAGRGGDYRWCAVPNSGGNDAQRVARRADYALPQRSGR